MNNDLISREALRNEIDTWGSNDYDKYDFLEAIDNAPTVEDCSLGIARKSLELGRSIGKLEGKNERPQGKWIITAEDNEGIHRIQCPFCRYEKGSDFIDYITVTFEKFPPFCESCGAELKGDAE